MKHWDSLRDRGILRKYGDIKMYGSKNVSITLPFEVSLVRTLVFENTGADKVVISLKGDVYLSGEGTRYVYAGMFVRHPHPGIIYLDASEKKILVISFDMDTHGKTCADESLLTYFLLNFYDQNYEVSLQNTVTVLSDEQIKIIKTTELLRERLLMLRGMH